MAQDSQSTMPVFGSSMAKGLISAYKGKFAIRLEGIIPGARPLGLTSVKGAFLRSLKSLNTSNLKGIESSVRTMATLMYQVSWEGSRAVTRGCDLPGTTYWDRMLEAIS